MESRPPNNNADKHEEIHPLDHVKESDLSDPFLRSFYHRIPHDVAATFTADQINAIRQAFGARSRGSHDVDVRLSIPLFNWRWYFVMLAGHDQRSHGRRREEQGRFPLLTLANVLFALILFCGFALAVLTLMYIVKSALGIDMIPGISLGVWPTIEEQLNYMFR